MRHLPFIVLLVAYLGCGDTTPSGDPQVIETAGKATTGGKGDVYGEDDRRNIDSPDVTLAQVRAAESTVVLVSKWRVDSLPPNGVNLASRSLADKQEAIYELPLCEDERFRDEPAPGFCSGFLIAPDLVATAGHCVSAGESCSDTWFAFGFHNDAENPTFIPDEDLFECETVVGHLFDRERIRDFAPDSTALYSDWAVLKLDRPVEHRSAVPLRDEAVSSGERIAAIGHPGGVPTKVTAGSVDGEPEQVWYNTDLDIYRGNSGSLIIDADGLAVGIASRGTGGTSYTIDEGRQCVASKVCETVDGTTRCFGNQAARIDMLGRFIGADVEVVPFAGGFGQTIPDDGTTKDVRFQVQGGGQVAYVTMNARIWHENPRSLEFSLVAPDGTQHLVMDRPVAWMNTDSHFSRTTFAFAGTDPVGEWTLRIRDTSAGDGGSQHVHNAELVIGTTPAP